MSLSRSAQRTVLLALALTCAACSSETRTTGATPSTTAARAGRLAIEEFRVAPGSHPHDVAPGPDGIVWYTAQAQGSLGRFDPAKNSGIQIPLGAGSSPHGVVTGPDGAAWVTDTGQNAIVRVDSRTRQVRRFRPAGGERLGMHTAVFDRDGTLWFTGSAGFYGRLDTERGKMDVFDAPDGSGPYGITATPSGDVYFASLSRSYVARVDPRSGAATKLELPTPDQGARRVWSDSKGCIWVTEWNAGKLARYDAEANRWREWDMPGDSQPYAVFVDDEDIVWISDFGTNAIVRFDPQSEEFTSVSLPADPGNVRQILGREGEVWGAESAADALVVIRT